MSSERGMTQPVIEHVRESVADRAAKIELRGFAGDPSQLVVSYVCPGAIDALLFCRVNCGVQADAAYGREVDAATDVWHERADGER
jgi:hypothetical protein